MQMANEPGGDRWIRLTDEAVDILISHFRSRPGRSSRRDASREGN
jgi:hypothetical protein